VFDPWAVLAHLDLHQRKEKQMKQILDAISYVGGLAVGVTLTAVAGVIVLVIAREVYEQLTKSDD
jgi:hypothetical protein